MTEDQSLIEIWLHRVLRVARWALFERIENNVNQWLGQKTSDVYILLFLGLITACCVLLGVSDAPLALVTSATVALYRLGDLTSRHLHSLFVVQKDLTTPGRSLALTLLSLCQVAMCFGIIFRVVEVLIPGSFVIIGAGREFRIGEALYLSFVTVTTLGAGDIYPLGLTAKVVSVSEVFVGLVFVAVVIARQMAFYGRR